MIHRLFSSIALIAILFTSIYYEGGNALAVILLALSIAATHELGCILQNMGILISRIGLGVANFALVTTTAMVSYYHSSVAAVAVCLVMFMLITFALALKLFRDIHNKDYQNRSISAILCLLALSLPISLFCIVALHSATSYALVVWVIFATKFTDIGGYLFGICLGNHKIAPSISPAKSWEGLIGGLFSSVVVGTFAIVAFKGVFPEGFTLLYAGLWAALIGFLGFLSDLLESAFKRVAKVKDSGATIPGIGGVLDLLDSMLVNAPIAFLMAVLYYN